MVCIGTYIVMCCYVSLPFLFVLLFSAFGTGYLRCLSILHTNTNSKQTLPSSQIILVFTLQFHSFEIVFLLDFISFSSYSFFSYFLKKKHKQIYLLVLVILFFAAKTHKKWMCVWGRKYETGIRTQREKESVTLIFCAMILWKLP